MKPIIGLLSIFISCISSAQKPIFPSWDFDITITSTRMKTYSTVSNKYTANVFKEAKIDIEDAKTENPKITLDIPNVFFIKSGTVWSVEYERNNHLEVTYRYSIESEDKFAMVTFSFKRNETKPYEIAVSIGEPVKDKNMYILYDFK